MKHKHIFFLSLFLFIFISVLFCTYIPVIWPDEVLFFNPAWELRTNGVMRSSVLEGLIPGMDTHTLWMPPLYMILLSGVFQFFPPELITARLFSSFISLGSIYLIYKICLQFQFSPKRISGVLLLLASDFLFLKFSHTARMESLCLFFALLAFYFLLREKKVMSSEDTVNRISITNIFLSGICLSLSFLSHPFGIVHSIPLLFLLYQKGSLNFKNVLLYAFAGFIPIALWGIYVIPNWELFVVQFGAQLSRKNELLGKFTWIEKGKIIFSVYKFPTIKLGFFVITIAITIYNLIINTSNQRVTTHLTSLVSESDSPEPVEWVKSSMTGNWLEKIKTSFNLFFLVWLFSILGFLFVSSESWYVFHMVVPFTFLLSSLVKNERFFFRFFLAMSLLYNLIIIIWVLYSNYFIYKTPEKTEVFFHLIEKEVERKNFIYLQAIPDPYFYLKKKFPEKIIHEFIPGELSGMQGRNPDGTEKKSYLTRLGIAKENYKIDANYYKKTIDKQDVFLFYNETLMNDYIREYLAKNSDEFERKIIKVETPKFSDLKLEAVIYVRR